MRSVLYYFFFSPPLSFVFVDILLFTTTEVFIRIIITENGVHVLFLFLHYVFAPTTSLCLFLLLLFSGEKAVCGNLIGSGFVYCDPDFAAALDSLFVFIFMQHVFFFLFFFKTNNV